MKYFAFALFVVITSGLHVFAQDDSKSEDDYKKVEVFAGYSFGLADDKYDTGSSIASFFRDRSPRHGFNVSVVYNRNKYFGLKGDVSATYIRDNIRKTYRFDNTTAFATGRKKASLYNFLGGIQLKDNASTKRFRPFGHAMLGVGSQESSTKNTNCFFVCDPDAPVFVSQSTGLAGAFGGGLDIRVNENLEVRAFQIDYNPMKMNRMKHNGRIGVGLVF